MGYVASSNGRAYAAGACVLMWHLMGQGFPSVLDVAHELGVSKSTARRWLQMAEAAGLVARAQKVRGSETMYLYYPFGEFAERRRAIRERV